MAACDYQINRLSLMLRRKLLLGLFAWWVCSLPASAQEQTALLARARVFAQLGPGVRALKRDSAGRYYVLTAPAAAVLLYNATGHQVGQIPTTPSKEASLVYGDDLDVDTSGRVYVADRGTNAVKVYAPDGTLSLTIAIPAPTSVAALPGGELAVASMKSARLVTVFDTLGKVVREFGDPTEIAERLELNRFLNIGRLATDPASHIYYAFDYLPEPTVRKYDRYGYAVFEIQLTALEFQPAAQAARREIARQERGRALTFKPLVTAVAVEPATQEIWMALGGLLLHFDRDGNRRTTYRTYTPDGARLEANAILVEPTRLLLAADPLGIYEFSRPDRAQP
jgi:hypothetical protein